MPRVKSNEKVPAKDVCLTPPQALDIIIQHLAPYRTVWESASGEGYLSDYLSTRGLNVVTNDIDYGYNSLEEAPDDYDVEVTNPPYSLKYEWINKVIERGKPAFLLLPSDTMFSAKLQKVAKEHGVVVHMPDKRINFKMPNKGWGGTATYHTSWFEFNTPLTRRYKGHIKINMVEWERPTVERIEQVIENNRDQVLGVS